MQSRNFLLNQCLKKPLIFFWVLRSNVIWGGLAQMVERALSMCEVAGSMPASSKLLPRLLVNIFKFFQPIFEKTH